MHIIWHFLSKLPHHSEIQMRICTTLGLETNEGVINIWLKPGQILGFSPHNILKPLLKDVLNILSTFGGQQKVASLSRNLPPASTLAQGAGCYFSWIFAGIWICLGFKITFHFGVSVSELVFITKRQWQEKGILGYISENLPLNPAGQCLALSTWGGVLNIPWPQCFPL